MFWPKDNSLLVIAGPSVKICPDFIFSPFQTIGLWFMHVCWFERKYFCNLWVNFFPFSVLIIILFAVTKLTIPDDWEFKVIPESIAIWFSNPVPTIGFWGKTKGTDWRCIFEPISALFASSCSKNGIKEAAIETTCIGEIAIKSTSEGVTLTKSCL